MIIDVVEDQRLIRDLLATAMSDQPGLELRHVLADAESAWSVWQRHPPQVAIVDIALPGMNGVQLGVLVKRAHPNVGVVLLSSHAYPRLLERLPADVARGWAYLRKEESDLTLLARAARVTVDGGMFFNTGDDGLDRVDVRNLSPRQVQMLQLLAEGLSNTAIASRMGIARKSVENGLNRIYAELGLDVDENERNRRVVAALLASQLLDVPR